MQILVRGDQTGQPGHAQGSAPAAREKWLCLTPGPLSGDQVERCTLQTLNTVPNLAFGPEC